MHYAAAKGAVVTMTMGVAREYAKDGIRALSISPGPVRTPFQDAAATTPELYKKFLDDVPMGRFGEAKEMAQAALWLASDASSYVTGSTFLVDGGLTAAYVTPE